MNKDGWKYKKFEDCISSAPKTSKILSSKYLKEGKYPIVSQEEDLISGYWNDECDVVHFDNPIVVFGDHTRKIKYIDFDFVVGADGVKILNPLPFINAKYFYYHLKWADIPSLGYSRHYKLLKELEIPIPPLSEQEAIVAELDLLSSVIEKQKKQLEELDTLAQSIFYDMFGDPTYVPLSSYIESLSAGKSLAGDEECNNKVLKTGAVTFDFFDETQVKNLPADYVPSELHKVKAGDLLISRMNTAELVGACAYVWNCPDNYYLPDRLWRAELVKDANPIFLWKVLISEKSKDQIRKNASGTSGTMKNISKPKLLSISVPDVPLPLQQAFAEKIQAIEGQKAGVKAAMADTQRLFDYTMDKYFG